jgi:hypothetical protein
MMGALRLLRRPANAVGRNHAALVAVRDGQVIAVGGYLWNGEYRKALVMDLAWHHPQPWRVTGGPDGPRDYPAGWHPMSDLRPCDIARLLRVADLAPGFHSDRGRKILGWQSRAEARAHRERERQQAREWSCCAKVGPRWLTCRSRCVVACSVVDKTGRCAAHA